MSVVCAACPLDFEQPSEVIKDCRNVAAPSPSCCKSLNSYIAGIQKQMLITNKQAIICATMFGSMLRKGGVMTNVYELCDVDLKDFSIQGNNATALLIGFSSVVTVSSCLTFQFIYVHLRGIEMQPMDSKVRSSSPFQSFFLLFFLFK